MEHEVPTPAARPTTVRLHGDERVDECRWLRRNEDPEVLAYLEEENRYAESVMGSAALPGRGPDQPVVRGCRVDRESPK